MKLNKLLAIPALALTAGISLAACGSQAAPSAAPTQTVAAAPAPTTPAPTTPAPAPAKVVYVPVAPAAPAQPALTDCGTGTFGEQVYAGADTSCPFALNVEAAWAVSGATGYVTAYSPVTGLNYTMYCTGGDPTVCTGGNNASVQFTG